MSPKFAVIPIEAKRSRGIPRKYEESIMRSLDLARDDRLNWDYSNEVESGKICGICGLLL